MKINGGNFERGFAGETEHAIDEGVGAVGLGHDLFRHRTGGGAGGRVKYQSRGGGESGSHGLFDIVGHASNHLAERGKLFGLEQSLVGAEGELRRLVSPTDLEAWRAELHHGARGTRGAWLHVWLGEYLLTVIEEPERARWHFRQARRLAPSREYAYGLAAYQDARTLLVVHHS